MGRTNPTFRDYVRRAERRWQPFRRGLRRRHRDDFDRLFEKARGHADAAGQATARDPALAMVLAIVLAQERELRELRERVGTADGGGERDAAAQGGEPIQSDASGED